MDPFPFRTTDEEGRCSELIGSEAFSLGMYKLRFETGQYWENLGQTCFYPYVEVRVVGYVMGQVRGILLPLKVNFVTCN